MPTFTSGDWWKLRKPSIRTAGSAADFRNTHLPHTIL